MSDGRRHAVALAIHDAARPGRVLLVRRPPDDADLPNAWGLPAASLKDDESGEDAARRAARDKLGVDVAVGRELNRGTKQRAGYTLEMRLFEAAITRGEPAVPRPVAGVTQYTQWRWGEAPDLVPAAERGSLCCRLFLEHVARVED
jgi:8-oxo-dGTP pyrophosphatase MutT (NUDIX family)